MEEANEIGNAGTFKRIVAKALPLAFIAGLIGLSSGPDVAAGGFFGTVAAAVYASGYLTSHLASASLGSGHSALFSSALLRLAAVGGGGFAAYTAGRQVLIAYLASFGVSFGALVISEAPRIKQRLQQQGVLIPGKAKADPSDSSKGATA